MIDEARDALARHGYATDRLALLGEGGQSACYGTGEIAILLDLTDASELDLTGHSHTPSGQSPAPHSRYAVLRWMADRAADAGMRTPRILAVGDEPRPYAVIEQAQGTPAHRHPLATERAVEWYRQLGQEIRKANSVETTGFGTFTPDGVNGYRGTFATWTDYLDRYLELYLGRGGTTLDALLAQDVVTEHDLAKVEARIREARTWRVGSVLTHYDNRPDNLVVADDVVTVLDWGLAFSGIGVQQELVKIFETAPTSSVDPRVAAYLSGYGLGENEARDAVEDGKLMLVLDGLAMASGWVGRPDRLGGVRGWLKTVRRLSQEW